MNDKKDDMDRTTSGHKLSQKKRIPIREGYFHEDILRPENSYLIGSRCSECEKYFFPKRKVCPVCVKEETMEDTRLSREGKIYSYSVLNVPLPGYKAPYMIGRTKLPEGPIVTSQITGCKAEEGVVDIGDTAELVIGKITEDKEGNDIIGYMFRPVKWAGE